MTKYNEMSDELIDLGDVVVETKGPSGVIADSLTSQQLPFGISDD